MGAGQDFTVMAWVKSSQTPTANKWPTIISKFDNTNGYNMVLWADTSLNKWYFECYIGGTQYTAWGAGSVNDGLWHHLAAVRQGNALQVFQDGVPGNIVGVSSGSLANSSPLRMGITADSGAWSTFTGAVDEAYIYQRALGCRN